MDIGIFVQNIKFFCERKGVKPTVACRDSGAGKSFIDQMERRGSIPSVEKVQLLAHYLGCTVSDLLGETSPPQVFTLHDSAVRVDTSDTLRLSVAEVKLALAYRNADQRARDMVDLALAPFSKEKTSSTAG